VALKMIESDRKVIQLGEQLASVNALFLSQDPSDSIKNFDAAFAGFQELQTFHENHQQKTDSKKLIASLRMVKELAEKYRLKSNYLLLLGTDLKTEITAHNNADEGEEFAIAARITQALKQWNQSVLEFGETETKTYVSNYAGGTSEITLTAPPDIAQDTYSAFQSVNNEPQGQLDEIGKKIAVVEMHAAAMKRKIAEFENSEKELSQADKRMIEDFELLKSMCSKEVAGWLTAEISSRAICMALVS